MIRAPLIACLIAVLFTTVLSTGCATRRAVRQVAADVKDLRTELGLLRQAHNVFAAQLDEVATTIKAVQSTTDEHYTVISSTGTDVGRLVARLDAAEDTLKRLREAMAPSAAPSPPPTPPSPAERPQADRVGTAENAYAAGLASFRSREYGQAVLEFLDVVTRHPGHVLAPAAQYWIGEAYYIQHDYRQALVEFQKVVSWPSGNSRIPDALVKVGLCYGTLREGARAQEVWRRVIREFPGSPAAAQARTLLASSRSSTRR